MYVTETVPTFPERTILCTLTASFFDRVSVTVGLTGVVTGTFHPSPLGRMFVIGLVGTTGTAEIMLSAMTELS